MNSQVYPPEKRRRKKSSRAPGLLEVMIDSVFFQVLMGKLSVNHIWDKSLREEDQSPVQRVEQSFPAMATDVILFGLLILFVPFYRVFRIISVWVYERWWVKFSLGVVTGVCSVMLVIFVLDLFFG